MTAANLVSVRHARLRLPFGQEVLLVSSAAVRPLDRHSAELVAQRLIDEDDPVVKELADRDVDDPTHAFAMLVERLLAGELLVVEMEDELRAWNPPRAPAAPSLSDLVVPEPRRNSPVPENVDEQPTLLRLELGALGFAPLGVLTLPRGGRSRRPYHHRPCARHVARGSRDAGRERRGPLGGVQRAVHGPMTRWVARVGQPRLVTRRAKA